MSPSGCASSRTVNPDSRIIRRAREGHPPWAAIQEGLDRLDTAAHDFDYPIVRAILQELVTEYQPENGIEDWVWRAIKEP